MDTKCELCGKTISELILVEHLKSCSRENEDAYLIHAFAQQYFIYFSADATQTLNDIDKFLRKIWVECCNHPSKFTINGISYFSPGQELDEMDKTMNVTKICCSKLIAFRTKKQIFGTSNKRFHSRTKVRGFQRCSM